MKDLKVAFFSINAKSETHPFRVSQGIPKSPLPGVLATA
jgi:hypothetical protein